MWRLKEAGGMKSADSGRNRVRALGPIVLVALGALVLASCTPETAFETADDYDVVVTLYDKNADYGTIRTYLMPDSVVHFEDPDNPGQPLSHEYDDLILERVEYNLQAIGYRKETDPENREPDIYVLVSATSSQWYAASYSWLPRWGWWPYWPGSSADWWFSSPYYGRGSAYNFSTGTLLIDVADNRGLEEDEDPPGIWTAAMNGILTDESTNAPQRLVDFIDRAFYQSPYLGADE
jgi:hypothetical protein